MAESNYFTVLHKVGGLNDYSWIKNGPVVSSDDFCNIKKLLLSGEFDFIFFSYCKDPYWHTGRSLARNVARFTKTLINNRGSLAHYWVVRWLKRSRSKLVVFNTHDAPFVPHRDEVLLHHCHCYFLREYPQNPAYAFLNTTAKNECAANILRQHKNQSWLPKIKPISLGIDDELFRKCSTIEIDKKYDIFFAGSVNNPIRSEGLSVIKKLGQVGYKVYIPDQPLSKDEFFHACASSYLTWSPAGIGWDCYRHYESIACGSIPVINYPWIRMAHPFVDREHVFYYDAADRESLSQTIKRALENKHRLLEMTQKARNHIFNHHTHTAILRYILETIRSIHLID